MCGSNLSHPTKGRLGGALGVREEDTVIAFACSRPLKVFNIN